MVPCWHLLTAFVLTAAFALYGIDFLSFPVPCLAASLSAGGAS